jgi:hypothetical protein
VNSIRSIASAMVSRTLAALWWFASVSTRQPTGLLTMMKIGLCDDHGLYASSMDSNGCKNSLHVTKLHRFSSLAGRIGGESLTRSAAGTGYQCYANAAGASTMTTIRNRHRFNSATFCPAKRAPNRRFTLSLTRPTCMFFARNWNR